jgi:hypothetical protein
MFSFIVFLMFSFSCTFFLISLTVANVYGVFMVEDFQEESNTKAKIILIEQKYKSDRFTDNTIGKVKNIGNGTAEFIQLTFNLYNKQGRLIGTEFTYSDPDTLKPGQKAPFNMFIDEKTGDKVKAFEVSLTWNNPDGSEEYIENVDVEQEDYINNFMFQEDKKSKKLTDEEIEKLGLFER